MGFTESARNVIFRQIKGTFYKMAPCKHWWIQLGTADAPRKDPDFFILTYKHNEK